MGIIINKTHKLLTTSGTVVGTKWDNAVDVLSIATLESKYSINIS